MINECEKEYKELKDILSTYMTIDNISEIDKYYEKAKIIYEGMKRLTDEDYIIHSIRVAKILAELKMDERTIGCALIHEAITIDKMTYEEIVNEFSEEDAIILNSISKLSHLKRNFRSDDVDRYRRIVVGLAENPISLFIKLADRLDNLRTLDVHDHEHMLDIVDETEKIYIPIAHRLGIKTMKSELEDLCLRNSSPELYNEVLDKINASKEELEDTLHKMRDELIKLLESHEIKFEMTYRVKSVRGIANKLKAGRKWSEIFDLLGLRILVEKKEECYLVIGLIHSKYRPIPKRFKDYIANPKNNLYQSIHTTVFGVNGNIFEIQVRTYEMNEIAEHGVASHWSYKEKTDGSKTSELENKLAQFRTLIEVNDAQGNSEFFDNFGANLDKEYIYVFTPKGDIIELPIDSTPIDFAYKIHSEIGNSCIGALVNGKQVSLDYKLQDSDIVDLRTEKGKAPSKAWLKFVKTDTAKSRIKSYFFKREKEKSIETGKELLIQEIKKQKYNVNDLLSEELLNELFKELRVDNMEELTLGITTYKYTPNQIVKRLIDIFDPKKDDTIDKLMANTDLIKDSENGKVLIAGYGDILTNLANCCHPVLGDEIVGYITKGNGVSIHRKDCKMIDINGERIINAIWNDKVSDRYVTALRVHIDTRDDNLVDIITIATKTETIITSINNLKKYKDEDVYELICKVKNKEFLDRFINEISSLKFVNKVER